MKKLILLAIAGLSSLFACHQAQAELIAYWNQNSNALPVSGFGFTKTPTDDFPQAADAGVGAGSLTVGGGITSETTFNVANSVDLYTWIESFAGTVENVLNAEPAGGSIALEGGTVVDTNPSNNGAYFQFQFNMSGYQNLVISYATRGTGSGFTSQQWSWSTDGTTFTPFESVGGITTTFAAKTLGSISTLNNVATAYVRVTFTGATSSTGNNRLDNIQFNADAIPGGGASVEGAFVQHFGYTGAGSSVDSVKSLHKEGGSPVALTYDNLINSSRGINGIAFDIQDLGNGGALSASDFSFQVSPTGAFNAGSNPPSGWSPAPAPVSVAVTPGSPDRVTIQWANNAIANQWLRITLLANANTGLLQPEVYYIGHLLGETTGVDLTGFYTVAFGDITPIRSQSGNTVNSGSIHDIDKSGTVSFADITAMRSNVGTQLTNISVP